MRRNTDNRPKNKIIVIGFQKGVQDVKIIVHYPKSQEGINILQKKVAAIHAETVLKYIDKLPGPKEQKLRLINTIIETGPVNS